MKELKFLGELYYIIVKEHHHSLWACCSSAVTSLIFLQNNTSHMRHMHSNTISSFKNTFKSNFRLILLHVNKVIELGKLP